MCSTKKVAELYHHDGANYSHDKENIGTIAQIEFAQKQNNYTEEEINNAIRIGLHALQN